ncbi:hypothetical protein ACFX2H_022614 [Malus domestica]
MDRLVHGPPNLGRLDSSVTVESVDLAVSSVGINSTAARTVDYLSKSRSRRISGSLLIEVREPKRPRRVPFSAAIARRRSQPCTQRNINKIYSSAELGRRVGTPRIHRRT